MRIGTRLILIGSLRGEKISTEQHFNKYSIGSMKFETKWGQIRER